VCDTCGWNSMPGNEHLIRAVGRLVRTGERREAITVLKSLLSENNYQAVHNACELFSSSEPARKHSGETRRVATVYAWCRAVSIPTNAGCMVWPAGHAVPSGPV
jgi:hypothetical protein